MDIGNGRYRLVRRLGTGGTSSVYQAVDRTLGRTVAVKALHDSIPIELLQEEAASLARLDHPHVVTIYDLIVDDNRPYLILEYVDGCDLEHWIAQRGKLAPEQALKVIRAVAAAIGEAHRRGILHCDLKPGNVLLSTSGEVKLTDLTLAHHKTAGGFRGPLGATTAYAAPEQLSGGPISTRTDIYGLGALLQRIVDLPSLTSAHGRQVLAVIERAMLPDPEDRFETVEAFLAALPDAATDTRLVAPSSLPALTRVAPIFARTISEPARKRWWPALMVGCLLSVGSVGAFTRFTVRAEPARITVPPLVGTDRSSAVLIARSLDLHPRITQAYSSIAPSGVISAQQPHPGSTVGAGAGLTLVVSLGPRPVPVANVQNLPQANAVSRLRVEGFRVALTSTDTISSPAGIVLSQSIPPGALRIPGTQVTLAISHKPWWWPF